METERKSSFLKIFIVAITVYTINAEKCGIDPLGMASSAIKSSQISVSSTAPGSNKDFARLGCCKGQSIGGWCADKNSATPHYIDVNFGRYVVIRGFAVTQPTNNGDNNKVTEFKVLVRRHGTESLYSPFPNINIINGMIPIQGTLVTNIVRIQIVKYTGMPCLQLELYGCNDASVLCSGQPCQNGGICYAENKCKCSSNFTGNSCERKVGFCSTPIGMASGAVKTSQFSASSTAADSNLEYARYNKHKTGWCPQQNRAGEWFQVDFNETFVLNGISMSHPALWPFASPFYLKTYIISYKFPGTDVWTTLTFGEDQIQEVPALTKNTSYSTTFKPVVAVRSVRITVKDFEKRPCFQFEILGCSSTALQNLCPTGYCFNGGVCAGTNTCKCESAFVGSRCQYAVRPVRLYFIEIYIEKSIRYVRTQSTRIICIGLPTIVAGSTPQKKAISLNGIDSALNLGDKKNDCLGDYTKCANGLTITMSVKVVQKTSKVVILSRTDNGLSLTYENDKFVAKVTYNKTVTTIRTETYTIDVSKWYKIDFSWSVQKGLHLYVNNEKLKVTTTAVPGATITTTTVEVKIGTATNIFSKLVIQDIEILKTAREILIDNGFGSKLIGTTSTLMPTTTSSTIKPTASQKVPTMEPVTALVTHQQMDTSTMSASIATEQTVTSERTSSETTMNNSPTVSSPSPKVTEPFEGTSSKTIRMERNTSLTTTFENSTLLTNTPSSSGPQLTTTVLSSAEMTTYSTTAERNASTTSTTPTTSDTGYLTTTPLPSTTVTSAVQTTPIPKTTPRPLQFNIFDLTFIKIVRNILITKSLNLTLTGNPFIWWERIRHPIELNGVNSSVVIPNVKNTCIGNFAKCDNGITITFSVRFLTLVENVYIVNSPSLVVRYNDNKLHFIARTETHEWKFSKNLTPLVQTWYNIELSWRQEIGLEIYIDKNLIHHVVTSTKKTRVPGGTVDFVFGGPDAKDSTSKYGHIRIAKVKIYEMTRSVLVVMGYITSKEPAISVINLSFEQITNYTIDVTPSMKGFIRGQPSVVNGPVGKAIRLVTNNQYVDIGSWENYCLGNLTKCESGITIEVTVKFEKLQENMFIISGGGQDPKSDGVAIFYRYGRIMAAFTTEQKEWYVSSDRPELNKWYTYYVTWSQDSGLYMWVDKELCAACKEVKGYLRNPVTSPQLFFDATAVQVNHVLIGRENTPVYNLNVGVMVVDEVKVKFEETKLIIPTVAPTTTTPKTVPTTTPTTTKPTTTPRPTTTPTTTPRSTTPTTTPVMTTMFSCPAGCVDIKTMKGPELTRNPVLVAGKNGKGDFILTCSMPTNLDQDVSLTVRWYIGSKVVSKTVLQPGRTSHQLDLRTIRNAPVGYSFQCEMFAEYSKSGCGSNPSRPRKSNVFNIKVEVRTNNLVVIEGEKPQFITIRINVPRYVLCLGQPRNCKITITTDVQIDRRDYRCADRRTYIPQAVIGWTNGPCGIEVTDDNYNKDLRIPIKAILDGKIHGDLIRTIKITVQNTATKKRIQRLIVGTETVKVRVVNKDRRASVCKSINDPHITTFDGRRYDNFYEGEFVLYRHRTLPYAIHAFYAKCGRASCNCGVAVMSGDDVILFDRCKSSKGHHKHKRGKKYKKYPVLTQMFLNGQLTDGTRVFQSGGNKYTVVLPSGGSLQVILSGNDWINLYFTPALSDFGKVEGLCGNYNGNAGDDIQDRKRVIFKRLLRTRRPDSFSKTWRAKSSESIYSGVSKKTPGRGSIYCKCMDNRAVCGYNLDIETCGLVTSGKDITSVLIKQSKQSYKGPRGRDRTSGSKSKKSKKSKRAVGDEEVDDTVPVFEYNEDFEPMPENATWPSDWIMTEAEANAHCRDKIEKSKAAEKCGKIVGNVSEEVADCVKDIKTSNETSYTESSLNAVKETCVNTLNKDTTLWKNDSDGGALPPVDIVDVLCLDDCNNNGDCINGTCQCREPWTGGTCSVNSTAPPTVVSGGLCDIVTENCELKAVLGDDFVPSGNLSCHMKRTEIKGIEKITVQPGVVMYTAEFVGFSQVNCPVPSVDNDFPRAYSVGVSNDGLVVSEDTVVVLTYNSECFECNVDDPLPTCTRLPNTCIIDGKCYIPLDTSPDDACKQCIPSVSDSDWQKKITGTCAPKTSTPDALGTVDIVVISVAGAIFALLLIAGLIWFCKFRNNVNKHSVELHRDPKTPVYSQPLTDNAIDNQAYDSLYDNAKPSTAQL